jgi:hypothetical protein
LLGSLLLLASLVLLAFLLLLDTLPVLHAPRTPGYHLRASGPAVQEHEEQNQIFLSLLVGHSAVNHLVVVFVTSYALGIGKVIFKRILEFKGGFLVFYVLYSTLFHLPPLRFPCVG